MTAPASCWRLPCAGLLSATAWRPAPNGVVFTNNDDAYLTALALKKAGVNVRVVDSRAAGRRHTDRPGARRRYRVSISVSVISAVEGSHGRDRGQALRPIARARAASSPKGRSTAISSPCRAAGIRRFISGATMAARSSLTTPCRASGPTAIGSDDRRWARPMARCRWPQTLAEAHAAGEAAAKAALKRPRPRSLKAPAVEGAEARAARSHSGLRRPRASIMKATSTSSISRMT